MRWMTMMTVSIPLGPKAKARSASKPVI
jgi:hypothetical protein